MCCLLCFLVWNCIKFGVLYCYRCDCYSWLLHVLLPLRRDKQYNAALLNFFWSCLQKLVCYYLLALPFNSWVLNILQVNGDTIYVTGNFKEFKVEDNSNTTWDQRSAMASTAVCSSLLVIECYWFVPSFLKLTSAVIPRTIWQTWTIQDKDIQLSSNYLIVIFKHLLFAYINMRLEHCQIIYCIRIYSPSLALPLSFNWQTAVRPVFLLIFNFCLHW